MTRRLEALKSIPLFALLDDETAVLARKLEVKDHI
jgi:hypothetical protein